LIASDGRPRDEYAAKIRHPKTVAAASKDKATVLRLDSFRFRFALLKRFKTTPWGEARLPIIIESLLMYNSNYISTGEQTKLLKTMMSFPATSAASAKVEIICPQIPVRDVDALHS
jgi:hypothetical protein